MRKARTAEEIAAVKAACEEMLANVVEGDTNILTGKTYKGKNLMVLSTSTGVKVFHDGENVLGMKDPNKKNAVWIGDVPLACRLQYKDYLEARPRKAGKPKKEKAEKVARKRGRPKKVVETSAETSSEIQA